MEIENKNKLIETGLAPKEAFEYLEGIDPGAIKETLDHIQKGFDKVIEFKDYRIIKHSVTSTNFVYLIEQRGRKLNKIDIEITFKHKDSGHGSHEKWLAGMVEFERLRKIANERKANCYECGDEKN